MEQEPWERHMHECAAALAEDPEALEALEALVRTSVLGDLPELAADPDMRREFDASLHGNVLATLAIYAGRLSADEIPVSREQVEFARTMCRRGVRLERILTAYRLGQSAFVPVWVSALAERVDDAHELAQIVSRSTSPHDRYFNRSVEAAVIAYTEEAERWTRIGAERQSEMVRRIIDGERPPREVAERVLRYALADRHTGLLVWSESASDGEDRDDVRTAVRGIAGVLGAHATLLLPVGLTSAWAWLSGAHRQTSTELVARLEAVLPVGVRVAFGRPARDVEGFVRSHRQALRAGRYAQGRRARVLWYDDVERAVLLTTDPEALREFLDHQLGDLGKDDNGTAALRDTLRVFLEEQGNARRAADRLFLHRNTVVYRVESAERLLGRPVEEDRLNLEIALAMVADADDGVESNDPPADRPSAPAGPA